MREDRVDVLILTALKDEFDAVLACIPRTGPQGGWAQREDPYGFPYHLHSLDTLDGQQLRVAAAWTGELGESTAAMRAATLINTLDPDCLAMCGICAGKPKDTSLGDVIVADRVFSYDHGKHVANQDGAVEFLRDITTYNLESTWVRNAQEFAPKFQRSWPGAETRPPTKDAQKRWLLRELRAHEETNGRLPSPVDHPERKRRCPQWPQLIEHLREAGLIDTSPGKLALTKQGESWVAEDRLRHPDGPPTDPEFRVHVGPIATGKTVREDPLLFKQLSVHVRKVLGLEMEAAAIGAVASKLRRRALIVKAVSDHGDADKDDAFRPFACRASARFLVEFLHRYLRPRPASQQRGDTTGAPAVLPESDNGPSRPSRHEFLDRVEKVCTLKWTHPGTAFQTLKAPAPFGHFLEVSTTKDKIHAIFPVAALDQDISEEALKAFDSAILGSYRRRSPGTMAYLVHTGRTAPEPLAHEARARHISLFSFEEFQGLIDLSPYVEQQTSRLRSDSIYLPEHYVAQRAQLLTDGQRQEPIEDVLPMLRGLLATPDPRFIVVLGEFGTGKTFLLHELARRMGQEGPALMPVLLEMRSLQKALHLRALLGQHFATSPLRHFSLDSFFYMLHEGRIALLLDGFDELALRVTYEQVLEHFNTITEAAQEKAKIVITSRTQHFLTDHHIKRELARRAETLPGYRILKLERFSQQQIRTFLVKRLENEAQAEERLKLLHDVKDLMGLSANPRLLSFIVELDTSKLEQARAGSGAITSAKLYELLLDKWLTGEHERLNPRGAPKGLSLQQLQRATTDLALLLWEKTERTVELSELPEDLLIAVNGLGPYSLEPGVVRHQLGSGTLLVRDEDGRFSFVHQSVMEWLVAQAAAAQLTAQGNTALLGRADISELMADFFIDLAGVDQARSWAYQQTASAGSDIVKKNALRILNRLRGRGLEPQLPPEAPLPKNLASSDLRGQDLSGNDLRKADLQLADLSGATLVRAELSEAKLQSAQLVRADLEQARLRGANLAQANLSHARLLGADLRGATLTGARLRGAKLVGAQVDSLEGCDVWGAALPELTSLEPMWMMRSAGFAVAFGPKDELLATGHEDGTVCLWDPVTGRVLRTLAAHRRSVRGLAFSPDGATLASTADDGTTFLWDVAQAERLHMLKGHGAIVSVAFSPDGTTLATASRDKTKTLALWNVASGERRQILPETGHYVRSVAFSPSGTILATACLDKTTLLWDITTGERLHVLGGHTSSVLSVAFSPDGSTVATGSADKTIALWNAADGEYLGRLRGHDSSVVSVAFNPDGATLASGSDDRTIALWNVTREERLRVLEGHKSYVRGIAFSPDGATLASVSDDRTVALWSVPGGERLRVLEGHKNSVEHVAFSPDGSSLAMASQDKTASVWSVVHGKRLRLLEGHRSYLLGVAFSPDGATLATASKDKTAALWSAARGERMLLLEGHTDAVTSVAFSPNGAVVATASQDKTAALWSTVRGERLRLLEGHADAVTSVAFSPDGSTLATASRDRTAALWLLTRREPPHRLEGHAGPVLGVAFSPDGSALATTSEDRTVILWNVRGERTRTLEPHGDAVRGLAFSPDNATLATACQDKTAALWNVATGERLRRLEGHKGPILGVAFSPDGRFLVTASEDGTARLWDVNTWNCLATLLGTPSGWVTFQPDGRYKSEGTTGGAFWLAAGLCRFEAGELDAYLPLRLSLTEPLSSSARPAAPRAARIASSAEPIALNTRLVLEGASPAPPRDEDAALRQRTATDETRDSLPPGTPSELGKHVYALGQSGLPSAVPELIRFLSHESPHVRRLAASALGKLKAVEALFPLVALLERETGPQVRTYAIKSLGFIGDARARPALEKVLSLAQEKDYNRQAAEEALLRLKHS